MSRTAAGGNIERDELWLQLDKNWRDNLEAAIGNTESSALDLATEDEVKDALQSVRVDGTSHSVVEKLSPAFASLLSFEKSLRAASQYEHVPALIWAGLVSVVEGARKSARNVNMGNTLKLMVELCESIPMLDRDNNPAIHQMPAVQYALMEFFEAYMGYCTECCNYFSSVPIESSSANKLSRGPRGMLDAAKNRIRRQWRVLRDALDRENQLDQARPQPASANFATNGPSNTSVDMNATSGRPPAVEFPVSTVDRGRNSAFVGRDDILVTIADEVNKPLQARRAKKSSAGGKGDVSASGIPNASPVVCVLHGLGGVGKTQIALEFHHAHRMDYEATFFMTAELDWKLASSFARIASKLQLLPRNAMDGGGPQEQNKAIEASRGWLQTTEHRWLLIFDNVDNFGDLSRYLPTESRCHGTIIITTQLSNVPPSIENVRVMPVAAFDPDTAAEGIFKYLRRKAKDEHEQKIAGDLAVLVGGLPLAIATIGGYAKQSHLDLGECYENITHKSALWEEMVLDTQPYERSLVSVFAEAFKALKDPARELLNVLAFLDPDSVPEELFAKAIEKHRFRHIQSMQDFPACHFDLHNRQLIRRDTTGGKSYISIHRVVQRNVLHDLNADFHKRRECFQQAFDIVRYMLPQTDPKAVPEADVWPLYDLHGRQILQLQAHSLWPEPPIPLPTAFAQILADMGMYMWFAGKFPEGIEALESAENILDDNKAKWNDNLRAHVYGLLGIITSFMGVSQRKRSMKFRKNAYQARRESDMGQKDPHERSRDEDIMVWNMHSDLAYGWIQEEDFERTENIMEECHEQYQKWDSNEDVIPFEYSKYYQLMSFCHMADQKPTKAVQAIERCYELIQKAAGGDHPMAPLIKFCHANLLWHTKAPEDRQRALDIHKAVLEKRRQMLGEFSHFTLESYSTCGKLCFDAGEIDEAKRHLETCLQPLKQAIWNEEGITRAKFRYTNVLRALARDAQAQGDTRSSKAFNEEAKKKETEVIQVIQRYRKEHAHYMPATEDIEQNLDQMVSFWAGRFTGRLVQPDLDYSILEDTEGKTRMAKRRRVD